MRGQRRFTCNRLQLQPVTLSGIAAPAGETDLPQVVTLIGGGGKTSLMYLWARCLKEKGLTVVTATTTKLCSESRTGFVFAQPASLAEARTLLDETRQKSDILTLTGDCIPLAGKISGIPSVWIDQLSKEFSDTIFLVEGDGAAGRPIKGHLPHEPVIPDSTTLLVPIIGIDILGKPMNFENVHRPAAFGEITGVKPGELIGPAAVIAALFNPGGYLRQAPKSASIMPLLNKIETLRSWKAGRSIAQQILTTGHPQLTSVLAGSVRNNCFVRLS